MDIPFSLLNNFIALLNEASPWLLLGLLIAGLMKVWLPSKLLSQHLGTGKSAIIKAALIGAPLPLCSCGVIPVATELKRSGASAPATSSFLVATPETGVDSVTVSYALLGPLLAIYRPIAAISSAIITGLLVTTTKHQQPLNTQPSPKTCCASNKVQQTTQSTASDSRLITHLVKTKQGITYAATKLIDDLKVWLAIGLVFATIIRTLVPETLLVNYGSGFSAMLLIIAFSIPMYICATASTPIAAGFIMAGISPGTALVFMMAGPATNISTLGVIKKEMGTAVLARYLLGVTLSAISFGLLLDYGINLFAIDIKQQMQHSHTMLPMWLSYFCSITLVCLAIKPLRNKLFV